MNLLVLSHHPLYRFTFTPGPNLLSAVAAAIHSSSLPPSLDPVFIFGFTILASWQLNLDFFLFLSFSFKDRFFGRETSILFFLSFFFKDRFFGRETSIFLSLSLSPFPLKIVFFGRKTSILFSLSFSFKDRFLREENLDFSLSLFSLKIVFFVKETLIFVSLSPFPLNIVFFGRETSIFFLSLFFSFKDRFLREGNFFLFLFFL